MVLKNYHKLLSLWEKTNKVKKKKKKKMICKQAFFLNNIVPQKALWN